jgi:hypothetical protein
MEQKKIYLTCLTLKREGKKENICMSIMGDPSSFGKRNEIHPTTRMPYS